MTRRQVLAASAALAMRASAAEPPARSLYAMRTFRLRNGAENQRQRTQAYLKNYVQMVKDAGSGPVGVFSASVGDNTPYLMAITSFKGYADMETCLAKLRTNL